MANYSRTNVITRLKRKTTIQGDCWLFHGSTIQSGYGQIIHNDKLELVHRVSASVYLNLDLKSDKLALHKSICPNKNCWNPDHLYVGTHCDNAADVKRELKTHCPQGHLYEGNSTLRYGRRYCNICNNARSKAWREARAKRVS